MWSIWTILAFVLQLQVCAAYHIPLSQRSSHLNVDGTAKLQTLRNHIAYTEQKLTRGFEVSRRHGRAKRARHQTQLGSKKRDVPLIDGDNLRWYGNIEVGTPSQTFSVDMDTGSTDLFLAGPECRSSCAGHNLYIANKSSTSVYVDESFNLTYADGSYVTGDQYRDTVSLAGYAAQDQTFGAANEFSDAFSSSNFPPDGLIGFAFKAISNYGTNSAFQTLVDEGALSEPIFAFKLASSGSELSVGGVNNELYTGSLTYTPVTQKGYWQISVDGLSVGGQQVFADFGAIVDTGTTMILAESMYVQQLYEAIGGTSVGNGLYTVPCDSIPEVGVTIGNTTFMMSQDTFSMGAYNSSGVDCVGGIGESDSLGDLWVLGDVFLRNTYTVFDVGGLRVGFAELA
ncbi:acid protease [Coniophora puteana RWD-64-598 SS2]|uniref:Acid protease n=1 Tax=Coniophora puteana (strain RWD-64-598) TaxID=741705 RepID=A0A5M3N3V2_CONPW|nr:acid protease [Coniophora puteana RWD-64-598 SS2]EIW85581.1 acid protease [Coniophora puteana RWD-64-598 SS2]